MIDIGACQDTHRGFDIGEDFMRRKHLKRINGRNKGFRMMNFIEKSELIKIRFWVAIVMGTAHCEFANIKLAPTQNINHQTVSFKFFFQENPQLKSQYIQYANL